jgi:chaperonin cofactor prefoldin
MASEALEIRIGQIETRTSDMASRIANLEGSFQQVDKRLDSIENRLARMESKMDTQFYWLLGVVLLGVLVPLLLRLVPS